VGRRRGQLPYGERESAGTTTQPKGVARPASARDGASRGPGRCGHARDQALVTDLPMLQIQVRPDGLAGRRAGNGAPAGREGLYERQATARLGVRGRELRRSRRRYGLAPGVGHLDAQHGREQQPRTGRHAQPEATSDDAAVKGGVRREFRDQQRTGLRDLVVVRPAPRGQLPDARMPGEPRAARGRTEELHEFMYGRADFGPADLGFHVTERGGPTMIGRGG
jgi:hypothetical protein